MAHQFVVQLTHKPGALAALCRELERQGVDLKAIGGGGIGEVGHVILKTADDVKTRAVLEAGFRPRVVLMEINSDVPAPFVFETQFREGWELYFG